MNIILCGYGKMGVMLEGMALQSDDMSILGVVHPGLYDSALDVPGKADIIIDFSYPGNLEAILERARLDGAAVLIGTTGLSEAQLQKLRDASSELRIMHSSNYSLGVAVMKRAAAMVASALGDGFDIEIVETHHNQKVDAPSGTAKMLLQAVDPDDSYAHVYGREGVTGARGREIGIHALRGGTVAGEHSVFFFGTDETLEIRHSATSRRIFAAGAMRAARFVIGQPAGLYCMDDVLR
ncbi:MAG: 4-hydroxy-tetrahydrodipicolinate reductase [Clostridia bacterium]|nr:4-hydroxy-tetrahydrodipicolinate reductase [Clostridia bacterium]